MNLMRALSFLNGLKSIPAIVARSRILNSTVGNVKTSVVLFLLSCLAISIVLTELWKSQIALLNCCLCNF